MSEKVVDFLARKKAKEEQVEKKEKYKPENRTLPGNKDPEDFIQMMMSKVAEKLGEKDKNYLTIFTNMAQIEKLPSSTSTDKTEEMQVQDFTRDQCIEHLIESNYLDWNKNAAFYKAVARKFRSFGKFDNE